MNRASRAPNLLSIATLIASHRTGGLIQMNTLSAAQESHQPGIGAAITASVFAAGLIIASIATLPGQAVRFEQGGAIVTDPLDGRLTDYGLRLKANQGPAIVTDPLDGRLTDYGLRLKANQGPAIVTDPLDGRLTDYGLRLKANQGPAIVTDPQDGRLTDYGLRLKANGR